MDLDLEQLVRCIHGSATKAAVYVTGGASQVRQACTGGSYAEPLKSTCAGLCQLVKLICESIDTFASADCKFLSYAGLHELLSQAKSPQYGASFTTKKRGGSFQLWMLALQAQHKC
jgi:hypothetical protein